MNISPARKIAFEVLHRVEVEGGYAADLLHARLGRPTEKGAKLGREDAALATELSLGVLRWQRLLDFLIEHQTKKPVASLDAEVLIALRLGLYQLRFLTRIPPSAAVNESVELVKQARKRSAAALVNAVLRRAPRGPVELLLPPALPLAERLGILHSHPTWLVERWIARYGKSRAIALLAANNQPPRATCAIHAPEHAEEIFAECRRAGLTVEPGLWLASACVLSGGHPAQTDAFRRGWIAVQDEASQMVPLLLEVQPGDSVLDLCAAPGGKTVALARAAGPNALVIAADFYEHRLRRMRVTLVRLRAQNVQLVALDGHQPLPFSAQFRRILVDAPCSGTGTLARNPEIRWRLRLDDLQDLHNRQVSLLSNAIRHLAPGGRLVYSTCSLEPEENESVVEAVLRQFGDLRQTLPPQALVSHLAPEKRATVVHKPQGKTATLWQDAAFRTFPPEHGTDGFFAVLLERK